ncbi:MAG: phosphoenolpyruvate--protein phosphotransferase [Myxococcales bacterium]|nr:phosphoenolpyruvate--protein phosphotransferase [Myxococcales bacterium]MDH3484052.1 phosphoenolpyruvate--protein phosphotransferase [Myxococcales bacterium]
MTRPARIKGIAASVGIGVGPARLSARERQGLTYRRISQDEIADELTSFQRAVTASREEIELAKQKLTQQHGPAYAPILDVYLLMHTDALLIDAIVDEIRGHKINAPWALGRVVERLKAPLLNDSSSYFRERARDIDHVKEHLLRHLSGKGRGESLASHPTILVARDLTPADAVHMLAPPTVGLVTEMGGANSHTAILARTFGVPAVVGTGPLPVSVEQDEMIVVDGFSGEVTIGAPPKEQRVAAARRDRFVSFLKSERTTNAVTLDGVSISVAANIELPSEVQAAIENGAEGVGLYRTEFMCLDRSEPPSEEEQVELYRTVAMAVAPNTVIFRTFDWRGDKRLQSDRVGEHQHDWLKTQIRAVLRASTEGSVALMFPMVATLQELENARSLVDECRGELDDDSARLVSLPIGMMVEVPSAALLAEQFAAHADFFAVGTNDLVQYTLGVDRRDHRAAASPLNPAVLRLLDQIIVAARNTDTPCSMCGDMAADPIGLGLALGLGYRKVSVPASVVPLARAVIRNVDLETATEAARGALDCASSKEVRDLALRRFGNELGALWRRQGIV